jgi:hypothetical protein
MTPRHYSNLALQPLAGEWRQGRSERRLEVLDPFTQQSLLSLNLATREDLDEAFLAAREAQKDWAAIAPAARAAVLHRAVEIFDQRKDEIVDWIIKESGSTRIKAQIEWGAARAITLEAASFPSRVHGRILPNDIPPAPDPALPGAGPGPGQRCGGQAGQRYPGHRRPAAGTHFRRSRPAPGRAERGGGQRRRDR